MKVEWKRFDALTPDELYALLQLRIDVFMIEQDCLYQELDGKDSESIHLLLSDNQQLLGYARVLFDSEKNALSFGRIVNRKNLRGQGLGKLMMEAIMSYLKEHHNHTPVVISAQCYLKSFYENYGFITEGDSYLEDGLPHIKMKHSGCHDTTS